MGRRKAGIHVKALLFDGHSARLVNNAPEPTPQPGEAIVRPTRAAITPHDRRTALGLTRHRGILGHQFVGIVESVTPGAEGSVHHRVDRDLVGKRVVAAPSVGCGSCARCKAGLSVHCPARTVLGDHGRPGCLAQRVAVPLAALDTVPEKVDDDHAVMAEPVAAALHAAGITRIQGRPYITVLGDGPVGLLAAQAMHRLNASVRVLGKHPQKLAACEKWGIRHRAEHEAGRREDQDVVVDATGSPAGLDLALRLVRPRGKVVLMSLGARAPLDPAAPPAGPAVLDPAALDRIVAGEIEILGCRCGPLGEALRTLERNQLDPLPLITRRARLDDGPELLRIAAQPDQIRVLVDMS